MTSFLGNLLSRSFAAQSEFEPRVAEPFESMTTANSGRLFLPVPHEEDIVGSDRVHSTATNEQKNQIVTTTQTPDNTERRDRNVSMDTIHRDRNKEQNQKTERRDGTPPVGSPHTSKSELAVQQKVQQIQSGRRRIVAEETLMNPAIPVVDISSEQPVDPDLRHSQQSVDPQRAAMKRPTKKNQPAQELRQHSQSTLPENDPSPDRHATKTTAARMSQPQQTQPSVEEITNVRDAIVPSNERIRMNDLAHDDANPFQDRNIANQLKAGSEKRRLEMKQEQDAHSFDDVHPVAAIVRPARLQPPMIRNESTDAQPPVIHVTIGRIEIKANIAAKPATERTQQTEPRLTLAEYMKQLHEGRH